MNELVRDAALPLPCKRFSCGQVANFSLDLYIQLIRTWPCCSKGSAFHFRSICYCGPFKFDFKGSCFFHGLTQCAAPFVRCVCRVGAITASRFQTEHNSSSKDLDNFRICDSPRFACATFRFPTLGHSGLLSFCFCKASSLRHSEASNVSIAVWSESSGAPIVRKGKFVQSVPHTRALDT